ncbi:response regulator [Vibrio sp. CAIM 722]|uniref:Response regulator n=1 Tax=Vibrio eleionomae TaxID=2653505 RepID=A0A7X4RVM9_9VIBR|nr:response regulator transcription factor [Vibrio eleionomae]MZI94462.1 response regulator [Vibrio eleionomae]
MKILIVEDSEVLRRSLVVGLNHLGFATDETGDGSEGLAMALQYEYDAIILDLMLPSIDGMSLLQKIRQQKINTRVLILSAKNQTQDRVDGLLKGADDYLTKPFSFDELHARILTLMRRSTTENRDDCLNVGEFCLNLAKRTFEYQHTPIELTPNEFKILNCLFRSPNRVISLESISDAVVGSYNYLSKNAIEVHISAIRRKVRKVHGNLPIRNKRGFGYLIQN